MTDQQNLKDEGPISKYFHVMLNIDDDELDPYPYRLLGHYRRVCGGSGVCYESITTTAAKTFMSINKARETRDYLAELGIIKLQFDNSSNGKGTVLVTLVDRMAENVKRYSVTPPCGGGVHVVEGSTPTSGGGVPLHVVESKNNSLKKTLSMSSDDDEGVPPIPAKTETAVRKRPINADFKDKLAILVYSHPAKALNVLWETNSKGVPKNRIAVQVSKTASEIVNLEIALLERKLTADDYAQLVNNIPAVLDYFAAAYPQAHKPTERFSKVYGEWVQAGRPGSKIRATAEVSTADDPEAVEYYRNLRPED